MKNTLSNDSNLRFGPPNSVSIPPTPVATVDRHVSCRSSQEPDETSFEGQYIGPTSGISFLYRAQSRFRSDCRSSSSKNINGKHPTRSSIFAFGDGSSPDYSESNFAFPKRKDARRLLERYFDFAVPTYRFLHCGIVESWLERLCNEYDNTNVIPGNLSPAKSAVVLMVLGTAMLYRSDDNGILRDGEADDYEQR